MSSVPEQIEQLFALMERGAITRMRFPVPAGGTASAG